MDGNYGLRKPKDKFGSFEKLWYYNSKFDSIPYCYIWRTLKQELFLEHCFTGRRGLISLAYTCVEGQIGNLIKNLDLRHNILSPRHPVWQPKIQSASMPF